MKSIAIIALSVALSLPTVGAYAQAFPSKPVRIVIGFPAGGQIDVVARLMTPRLADAFGQSVIVDNRPGANGVLATDLVAKSPPDGHTLFLGTLGNLAVNPHVYQNLPFNLEKDLAPVTQLASLSLMLLAHPSVPYKTVPELIAHAKANPAKVDYATSGNGSTPHLAGELFNLMAGVKTQHIPYRGSAPAMADLIGGQVQISWDTVGTNLPNIAAGKLRAIAVTAPKRQPVLPDVPTVAEFLPGYAVTNWFGMMVPAGTPPETIERWRTEVVKAINIPEIREKVLALGVEPVGSTTGEFAAFLKDENAKWARVIKEAKIQVN